MNLFSLSLFSIILLISCQAKPKADFSFIPPSGWTVIDTTQKGQERFVFMHPSISDSMPVVNEGITIGINHFSSIDVYIKELFDRIKSEVAYFQEIGNGISQVNNHEIRWRQYKIQKDTASELYEQKTLFIESKGAIYEITCTARPNGIKEMEAEIDSLLKSFKTQ